MTLYVCPICGRSCVDNPADNLVWCKNREGHRDLGYKQEYHLMKIMTEEQQRMQYATTVGELLSFLEGFPLETTLRVYDAKNDEYKRTLEYPVVMQIVEFEEGKVPTLTVWPRT